MDKEKLIKANELREKIRQLRVHRDEVFPDKVNDPYSPWETNEPKPGMDVYYRSLSRRDSIALKPELLPITLANFMTLYHMALDRQIDALEIEFHAL